MNKRIISTAVIGSGYWGRNYVRNLASLPEAQLRWVCDVNEAARQRALRIAPATRVTASLTEVLADPEVEAVIIATQVTSHYEHALAALRAGKHVLVEKPMTTSTEQARKLVETAQEARLTLMVGHLMLYHPVVERLQQMIQAGELGRVYYMYALRVNLGQVRADENALWSFGPHDLSVIRYLVQMQPATVWARGRAYLRPDVEDVVFVNLDFPDRSMAQIQLSWLDPHKSRSLTVVGSKKMVSFDDTHASEKLRIYDRGFDRPLEYDSYSDYLALRNGDVHIPNVALSEPLTAECLHFLHCVRSGETPRSDGKDGLAVVAILEAAARSMARGGVPITLDAPLI